MYNNEETLVLLFLSKKKKIAMNWVVQICTYTHTYLWPSHFIANDLSRFSRRQLMEVKSSLKPSIGDVRAGIFGSRHNGSMMNAWRANGAAGKRSKI